MTTPVRRQRLCVRALLVEDAKVLLARIAPSGYGTAGTWTLPGGGVDHGEHPKDSLRREMYEETGLVVSPGNVVGVFSHHFTGVAPSGQLENYHGVHLIYAAYIGSDHREPRVMEVHGTTDAVAWVDCDKAESAAFPAADVTRYALRWAPGREPRSGA